MAIAGLRSVRARNAVQGIDGHRARDGGAVRSRVRVRLVEGCGSGQIAVVSGARLNLARARCDYSRRRAIGCRRVFERLVTLDLSLESDDGDCALPASQLLAEGPGR